MVEETDSDYRVLVFEIEMVNTERKEIVKVRDNTKKVNWKKFRMALITARENMAETIPDVYEHVAHLMEVINY